MTFTGNSSWFLVVLSTGYQIFGQDLWTISKSGIFSVPHQTLSWKISQSNLQDWMIQFTVWWICAQIAPWVCLGNFAALGIYDVNIYILKYIIDFFHWEVKK